MVHSFTNALLTPALRVNRIRRNALYMQAVGLLAAVEGAVLCARRSVLVVVQPACAVRCFFVPLTLFFQRPRFLFGVKQNAHEHIHPPYVPRMPCA